MTDEQYQKRILFLEHIKKNYVAVKDKVLIFYFDDYEISTIETELLIPEKSTTGHYFLYRHDQKNGAVRMFYDYDGLIYLNLTDAFIDISYNMTMFCYEYSDLHMPIDMKKVAAELNELFQLLKSK